MDQVSSVPFFISDRLRGIPLVSAGRSATAAAITTTTTTTMKPVSIEKRQVNQGGTMDLLFKPSAMTASTANYLKKKTLSTTKLTKLTAISTTTTRKPTTTTLRTTRAKKTDTKPKATSSTTTTNKPMLAKLIKSVEAANSVRLPAANERSETRPRMFNDSGGSFNSAQPTTTTTEPSTTAIVKSNKRIDSNFNQNSATFFTKSSQFITSAGQPSLNQRRTTQTLQTPNYTNQGRFSANAGENWILFNRPDGNFSLFETMVLMSNVFIVCTIILVTIFSWIKAFRKKHKLNRADSELTAPKSLAQQQNGSGLEDNSNEPSANQHHQHQLDGLSDKTSKISMISSATSVPTTTTISDSVAATTNHSVIEIDTNKPSNNSNQNIAAKTMPAMNTTSQLGDQGSGNKAMAIVQPTENTTSANTNLRPEKSITRANTELNVLKEGLADNTNPRLHPMNRSVSDLSRAANSTKSQYDSVVPSEIARITQLEHLFDGSAPDSLDLTMKEKKINKSKVKPPTINELASKSNSLESIELPQALVESIEKSDKNPAKIDAPSPNLLLGEVDKTLSMVQPTTVATKEKDARDEKPSVVDKNEPTKASLDEKIKNSQRGDDLKERLPKMAIEKPPEAHIVEQKSATDGNDKQKVESMRTDANANSVNDRPGNPMGRDAKETDLSANGKQSLKNHQIVVNRLDRRKTNLEIVDLRDESVTGKMRKGFSLDNKTMIDGDSLLADGQQQEQEGWISMDGVAVVQAAPPQPLSGSPHRSASQSPTMQTANQAQILSPSEIIESRFHVDYKQKNKSKLINGKKVNNGSLDSKTEEILLNDIENELELDNKMRNRKYFVYVVHDGHFTAKKECIARIELPPKKKVTLAELRALISNSQDVSLSSLRKSKFKFVTETYRLLTENEDAAVLHQVYPTQGVFLKLNIPEQENPIYPYKSNRLSTVSKLSGDQSSSLAQTTIASRRRAAARFGARATDNMLPAIEVNNYGGANVRASSSSRQQAINLNRKLLGPRSKSSVQTGRGRNATDRLPQIGRSKVASINSSSSRNNVRGGAEREKFPVARNKAKEPIVKKAVRQPSMMSQTASDLGSNVLSGAKKLFNATFKR